MPPRMRKMELARTKDPLPHLPRSLDGGMSEESLVRPVP